MRFNPAIECLNAELTLLISATPGYSGTIPSEFGVPESEEVKLLRRAKMLLQDAESASGSGVTHKLTARQLALGNGWEINIVL